MSGELYGLGARFAEAEARAEALRAGLPAGAGDAGAELAQAAQEGRALTRFLQDMEEALKQLFVAGLAYPDPELPEELEALAERAGRHGLFSAVSSLLRLRAWLEGIGGQRDLLLRQQMAQRAWDEAQRFLAWLRLLRGEHDFLMVQGRMAAEATEEVRDNRASYPTRSATVWPLGMELDSGGRLLVFCQEVETGRYVLLRDQLAEFDAQDPLGGRAISRLFQDAIRLSRLFESVVRLEDHPVVARAATWLFRPAFQATPRLLPVSSAFRAPEIPELELEANGEPRVSRAIPSLLRGYLVMHNGRPDVRLPNHGSARLQGGEVLRLNLTKLLLREQVERQEVELVVMPRDEGLLPLSLRTDFDGRVFPAQDPTLFRLSGDVLNARAQGHAATAPGGLGALWLRGGRGAAGGGRPRRAPRGCARRSRPLRRVGSRGTTAWGCCASCGRRGWGWRGSRRCCGMCSRWCWGSRPRRRTRWRWCWGAIQARPRRRICGAWTGRRCTRRSGSPSRPTWWMGCGTRCGWSTTRGTRAS
jgi:hypothetical protein